MECVRSNIRSVQSMQAYASCVLGLEDEKICFYLIVPPQTTGGCSVKKSKRRVNTGSRVGA